MSRTLVGRSPDLQRLRDEGYEVDVVSNYLVIRHVPYVTSGREVAYGTLVSELTTSGETTARPSDHVAWFVGSVPCDEHGQELTKILSQKIENRLAEGLVASCSFSSKPPEGYPDYYEKMTSYVGMLQMHAQAINPAVTAQTCKPVPTIEDESVFRYIDSSSSRARIVAVTEKLEAPKVVIIGLGGTGAYILDLVAKTPVQSIHLYDGDRLRTHNSFRTPGAASLVQLNAAPTKVEYLRGIYDAMHRRITAHPVHVDETNIDELGDATFVFIAIDNGPAREFITTKLHEFQVPFIDVGMGIGQKEDSLEGILRVTASDAAHRDHVHHRVPFTDDAGDLYEQNIQIADLNMLNAALAVIKWKKMFGFYWDFESEYHSTYTIDGNHLLNEERG